MKQVAVLLSGCGVFDGSEIHESVITLLALQRAGLPAQIVAPDIQQAEVIDHISQQVIEDDQRSVMQEAARIARGPVRNIAECPQNEFAAVVLPGGYGAAKNLCNFAVAGAGMDIHPDVMTFLMGFADAAKPAVYFCIAPVIAAKIYPTGARLTIGNDADTAQKIVAMGADHVACDTNEYVHDERYQLFSSPAYMTAEHIGEAADGIEKTIRAMAKLL